MIFKHNEDEEVHLCVVAINFVRQGKHGGLVVVHFG